MEEYDIIIVGAGAAGCVLANRLSVDRKVLLIEAGPDASGLLFDIPIGIVATYRMSKWNWRYYSEPEPELNHRRIYTPRGKCLGGSTMINAMVYTRGNPQDFDHWQALGNPGWDYQSVLPYFKKFENHYREANHVHATNGPMVINQSCPIYPYAEWIIEAAGKNNIPFNPDYNSDNQLGISHCQIFNDGKKRSSVKSAYIDPLRERPNLSILNNALVSHIIMQNKKAIGVDVLVDNRSKKIYAKDMIVLSGGAINSPQLLMLSGIGPANILNKNGIKIVQELPGVGKNLKDHLNVYLYYQTKKSKGVYRRRDFIIDIFNYWRNKAGLYARPPIDLVSFFNTEKNNSVPNIEIESIPTLISLETGRFPLQMGFQSAISFLHPQSHGDISLDSNDPRQAAKIKYNYLAEPNDLAQMLSGIKKWLHVLHSNPICSNIKKPHGNTPALSADDKVIIKFIRENAGSIYHPVGTCKMGVDNLAVVDPATLNVRGVENLKVIDASIMPDIVSGNTEAAVLMIAEKAADQCF